MTAGLADPVVGAFFGDFDADTTNDRLRDCTTCPQPDLVQHGSLSYYDWGEGLGAGERLQPPVFDNLGQGGMYRFTDRYVLRTLDRESMEGALDAFAEERSILDYAGYRELAQGLDEIEQREGVDLLSVTITDQRAGPTERTALGDDLLAHPAVRSALEQQLLRPYRSLALAYGTRDGEPIMALLLSHSSAAEATENVRRLD